jgi:hypothetical protein
LFSHLGDGAAADWLRGALDDVRAEGAAAGAAGSAGGGALDRCFGAAGRWLGRAPISVVDGDGAVGVEVRLAPEGPPLPLGAWAADEWGRALLLHAALDAAAKADKGPSADAGVVGGVDAGVVGGADAPLARVEALFRGGDLREQQAVARCLAYLPHPARFVPLGIEIVRSNAAALLGAIACRNRFPAAYFPEAAFNQMVVKCLYVGLPLGEIVGLTERRSAELVRMVGAFASERRAAGRAVPADAALLL